MSDFTYNSFPIPAKPLSGVGETSYLSALLGIAPGGVKKVPTASFLAAAGVYPVALLQCTPQITQVIGDVAANTTLIPLIADTTVSGGDTGVSTGGMSVGDTSPNSGKIVISEAGLYRVSCSIRITRTSSDGGECGAVIMKNGSSVITSVYDEADTDDHFTLTCPTVIASLASGDVLSLHAAIVGGSSDSIYVNGASLLPEDVPNPTSVVLVERLNSASGDSSSTESLAELAAEVQDAREGYDGTTYASLGAAIRGQVEEAMQSGGGGVSDELKAALLQIASKVAYIDDQGQSYYDDLYNAFYQPATLVSISAVYTQTGKVYDTDSLDDLTANLVVTGHYDDGTDRNINDYTLSGTLEEGTSTITVSYEGKTATFTVEVTKGVPAAYTAYDWLKGKNTNDAARSGQGKTNWIILKTYANLNELSCEFAFERNDTNTDTVALFGRRSVSGTDYSYAIYTKIGGLGYQMHGTSAGDNTASATDNVRHIAKYTQGSASPSTLQVDDGTPVEIAWANNNTLNLAPVLFANPTNDSNTSVYCNCKLGYIKFFDLTNELVGHYVPVLRKSDNKMGMYDFVSEQFYTSSAAAATTDGNANAIYQIGNWS